MWDAGQYLKYAQQRGRPFFDLLGQVHRPRFSTIVDLGCGAGNLTRTLCERWPMASVVGVDSSPQMLEQARHFALPGRLDFALGDIARWEPPEPVDLIVSNAALQWLDDHDALLDKLTGSLAPQGTLAVQMPHRFENASQRAIEETSADPRWAGRLAGIGLHRKSVLPTHWYVAKLRALGCQVNAWETTYIHVLQGDNPALDWLRGTALRPLLERLEEPQRTQFLEDLGQRLARLYPPSQGVTLFPMPRLFFVADRRLT